MKNNNEMQEQQEQELEQKKENINIVSIKCRNNNVYQNINATSQTTTIANSFNNFMLIKIYVNSDDVELKEKYINSADIHNRKIIDNPDQYDAGFDIYFPEPVTIDDYVRSKKSKIKINYNIKCCAFMCKLNFCGNDSYEILCNPTAFYTYARSSISNSCFRLANNQGIIDAGYRGELMSVFDIIDVFNETGFLNEFKVYDKFTRVMQICAPNLVPICVQIVDTLDELGGPTIRGEGGFGSSGIV